MATKNGGKTIFGENCHITLHKIAQSLTVSGNNVFLCFMQKFMMATKTGGKTRLGQLGANISPDRSSLTPQVLIGNFLKHNYPLLYELQHINLLCLYLPKEDGVSPDAEYITQIIFSIFLQ